MKNSYLHIILLLLTTSFAVHADVPDTIQLKGVEVKASAIEAQWQWKGKSMDTLAIQAQEMHHLGDLLRQHSSVFIRQHGSGGLASASFRGAAGNHTLVMWNGMPLNGPQLGQVDFSSIPVGFVDQVSLFWGHAASARQGGLGGIVELSNRPVFNDGLRVELNQAIGSFSTFSSRARVSVSNGRLHSRTRFFSHQSENDFTFVNTASWPVKEMRHPDASFHDKGVLQELHFLAGKSLLSFISWNQWNHRNIAPIMTNMQRGGKPREFQSDRFSRNVLAYKLFWHNGKMDIKTSVFDEKQHYFLRTTSSIEPYSVVTLVDSHNQSTSFLNSLEVMQTLYPNWDVQLKTLYDIEKVNTINFVRSRKREKMAALLSTTFRANEYWQMEAVIRHDWSDGVSLGLNPSASAYFRPVRTLPFRMGVGLSKNTRLPSLNDLYWYPGGNENLRPERSRQTELSLDLKPELWKLDFESRLSIYFSDINDWIQWRPTSWRYWVPVNIARVMARGIDFTTKAGASLNDFRIHSSFNYAYTITTDESPVARIENNAGKQLVYIPKHNMNLFLHLDYNNVQLQYMLDYTGKRFTSLDGDQVVFGQLPAYALHDISAGYTKLGWTIQLAVKNLLDTSYQSVMWRPMPGRHYSVSLQYSFHRKPDNQVMKSGKKD